METYSDFSMMRSRTVLDEIDTAMLAWRQVEVIADTERTRLAQIKDEVSDLMVKLSTKTEELELLKKKGASNG